MLTAKQSLLRALVKACGARGREAVFQWSDLVVLAWKEDKKRFGMRGHDFPDAKRVGAEVCKMVPRRRWQTKHGKPTLERIGQGMYRLTAEGMRIGSRRKGAAA